jgi:hypothetical protein
MGRHPTDAFKSRARRQLKRFITEHYGERGQSAFARDAGLTALTVSHLLLGRVRPTLDNAIQLEELTKGYVRCMDWKETK